MIGTKFINWELTSISRNTYVIICRHCAHIGEKGGDVVPIAVDHII